MIIFYMKIEARDSFVLQLVRFPLMGYLLTQQAWYQIYNLEASRSKPLSQRSATFSFNTRDLVRVALKSNGI